MPPVSAAAPVFDRLAGLESEYAIRFVPDEPGRRPTDYALYQAVVAELAQEMALVPAAHAKKGVFLETGGAVWYEKAMYHPFGRIEGSTPECRGPRELLLRQRAQDAAVASAARGADVPGELALCKSDCDARGNVYGAQENYEATIGDGRDLWRWRTGRLALVPLVVASYLLIVPLCGPVGAVALAAGALLVPFAMAAGLLQLAGWGAGARWLRRRTLGRESGPYFSLVQANQFFPPLVAWPFMALEHALAAPVGLALVGLSRSAAFRRQRRAIMAFLASRAVFCGAGRLDGNGRFHIAAKAHGITREVGLGGWFGRPVFNVGHFFKALFYGWIFPGLWCPPGPRQRLQISLGDSNLCEEAEYLRLGTTMLVLDATEAGELDDAPELTRPIKALHRITADESLTEAVDCRDGRRRTAMEIQRFYLERCRSFLQRRADAPEEARDVLRRWEEVLDLLDSDRGRLVGRVDWVTKRYLLDRCAADAPWEVRKKIDLRYHELSPDGYFERLRQASVPASLLGEVEVDAARRTAPPDSPAEVRGRLVREHARRGDVRVSWRSVAIGLPGAGRVVKLWQFPRGETSERPRPL